MPASWRCRCWGTCRTASTWSAKKLAAARYDVDWAALDYLTDTSWLTMPALVFHGTADKTVPVATSRELEQDKTSLVTLVETLGVEHVRSWNDDPAAYVARIRKFLGRSTRPRGHQARATRSA